MYLCCIFLLMANKLKKKIEKIESDETVQWGMRSCFVITDFKRKKVLEQIYPNGYKDWSAYVKDIEKL